VQLKEQEAFPVSGWLALVLGLVGVGLGVAVAAGAIELDLANEARALIGVGVVVVSFLVLTGLKVVAPNEGRVLQLFGAYRGTVKTDGLRWVNPFYSGKTVSLRVRSFETAKLKVNDLDGNPIEIAAVVVWHIVDTALASFAVEDYLKFVQMQAESALRNLATHYPYDGHDDTSSLRGATDIVAQKLKEEILARVAQAGVQIQEARIAHLAYAPEIAHAMLQRQQATAIIAARSKIVEGAVGMVEHALALLSAKGVVQLDEERKAQMVSNLLVVLCGDRSTQPIVNAGTLY